MSSFRASEFGAQRIERRASDSGVNRLSEFGSELLAGGQGLPRHPVPDAAPLFENYQHAAHITRTSNLSFSTSWAATVLASPSKICVCLLFCGT